jgi:hypothetical protein
MNNDELGVFHDNGGVSFVMTLEEALTFERRLEATGGSELVGAPTVRYRMTKEQAVALAKHMGGAIGLDENDDRVQDAIGEVTR